MSPCTGTAISVWRLWRHRATGGTGVWEQEHHLPRSSACSLVRLQPGQILSHAASNRHVARLPLTAVCPNRPYYHGNTYFLHQTAAYLSGWPCLRFVLCKASKSKSQECAGAARLSQPRFFGTGALRGRILLDTSKNVSRASAVESLEQYCLCCCSPAMGEYGRGIAGRHPARQGPPN